MKRLMLVAVLGLIGCGEVTASREDDAGSGGAQAADPGTGGATAARGSGGEQGSGGAAVDGGGSGGAAQPGTGGSGSGGSGTGGAAAETPICVDPNGWPIGGVSSECYKPDGSGGFNSKKKDGHFCTTNCQSTHPGGGAAGNYIGPPQHPECLVGDFICVFDCNECT